jgi:hypothetical protein
MKLSRRKFLAAGAAASSTVVLGRALAAEAMPPARDRSPRQHDPAVVAEFVSAAHRDFDRVKAMVAEDRTLVVAARDTGNVGIGDWETGLNGAAHTGRRDIALFLLAQGARLDVFCAAMLGYRDAVLALLKADPQIANVKGPHLLTLLYHAAIGGDVAIAEAIKPLLPPGANDFNQALSAAARDGRLEMTRWLLANGATNVNAPDGFRKTPLKIAVEKGFDDVADVLRAHGGREVP